MQSQMYRHVCKYADTVKKQSLMKTLKLQLTFS